MFEHSRDACLITTHQGLVLSMNQAACELFNSPFFDGLKLGSLLPCFDKNDDLPLSLLAYQNNLPLTMSGLNDCDTRLALQLNGFDVTDDTVTLLLSNESRNHPLQEELLRQREVQQVTLSSISDGIIVVNAKGVIATMNEAAREMLGLGAGGGEGEHVDRILKLCAEDADVILEPIFDQVLAKGDRVLADSESRLLVEKKNPLPVSVQASPVRSSQATVVGAVITIRDISEARRLSAKLSWQANHDALTLLPNRSYFEAELSRAMEAARFGTAVHGLIYVDLYQFQIVNDTCGHAAGDELLKRLGQLFGKTLRSQDLLARLGSDEFGILLRNCTLAGTQRVANLLLRGVEQFVFAWGGKRLSVGISVGAVAIDRDSESDAQVMAAAEASCAAAKEAGRNRIHLYHHHNSQIVERRRNEMHWVAKINEAIAENRLVLFQQAVVPVDIENDSAHVPHYEILVRMRDRDGSIILPGQFIPAAERYGLMEDIDRWVLTNVLDFIARRERAELPKVSYAVNLSGPTLGNESFRDFVLQELARTNIEPSALNFEITETAAVGNFNRAIRFIETFRSKGCAFYLDDFGSGMSSFSYLKDLPVDFLKIDGAFIRSMETDSVDFAMVSAINHLAHVMGIKTVAEYVENEGILTLLKELGVDFAQGYGISEPAPVHSLR
jgi:diguanylate cyclase (GGDEF)-like protein/PAS domain S-box-containing protein